MTETLQNAFRLHAAGRIEDAARLYADVLRTDPGQFDALLQLGAIHLQSGHLAEADRLLAAAIRANPSAAEAHYARGCVMQNWQRHEEALASFAQALAVRPDFVEARNNRGVVLLALGRHAEALVSFDKVAAERPHLAVAHTNRAIALQGIGRSEDAFAAADAALKLDPASADAYCARGAALAAMSRNREALADFDKAIAIRRDFAEALSRRGIVLATLGQYDESLADFEKALRLTPSVPALLYNHAHTLTLMNRFGEAAGEFAAVLRAAPDFPFARGNLLQCRLSVCDWRNLGEEIAQTRAALAKGAQIIRPLQNIAISESEADQLECSRIWVAYECPPVAPLWKGENYTHDRIRVAYISADFRDHSVAKLAAGAFEQHDKAAFETFAISIGPDDRSTVRARLLKAFDHFTDGRERSDADLASLLRGLEIDIAVDLMGFTRDARSGILARRPAPIQVNWLGFPGTMGAPFIDYIFADRIAIPPSSVQYYSEALVYLPDCYLPNDRTRVIGRAPSRSEAGLPESGFVFSAFNAPFKIRADSFAIWMRLLRAVDGSVLWLASAGDEARRRLQHEAEANGVAKERLVFANHVDAEAGHLARLSLANLYLDTWPYNAHASACDSLWAGVPMVTCSGTSFAGRVGASVLSAAGLPELIANSREEYEELALALARDPTRLADLRAKLARLRGSSPLFDTRRFTRHLEAAFRQMHERSREGLPPESFAVPALSPDR